MIVQGKTAESTGHQIVWETLPADYQLPDDPVENQGHPLLALGVRELLVAAGKITPNTLVASNFGICATVDGKIVVKAPDWVYIPSVPALEEDRRSYTPVADGDKPLVVMEFLSKNDNGEYSVSSAPPYGKWWFYEQILQVPIYVIFDPKDGRLEVNRLQSGRYQLQEADINGRFSIPGIDLWIGVWYGTKEERTGYWLRWWDNQGNMLLWSSEQLVQQKEQLAQKDEQLVQKEEQLVEKDEQLVQKDEQLAQERQRADTAEERIKRWRDRLLAAGITEEELRELNGE